MFDHHRKSPWFAEKYDPSTQYAYLRKRVRKEGWRGRLNTFLENLDAGLFDPQSGNLYQPSSPAKQSVTLKKEEAKEDQEALPDHDGLAPVDESMKVDEDVIVEVEEEGDKLDANVQSIENGKKDSRDRGEEVSVAPEGHQIMIRTIPPDIGRVKLETVGVRVLCRLFENNVLSGCHRPLIPSPALFTSLWEILFKSATSIALVG
jgi:SERRATE/Ars2, N-terminal domain